MGVSKKHESGSFFQKLAALLDITRAVPVPSTNAGGEELLLSGSGCCLTQRCFCCSGAPGTPGAGPAAGGCAGHVGWKELPREAQGGEFGVCFFPDLLSQCLTLPGAGCFWTGQALAFLESLHHPAATLVFLLGSGLSLTLGIFIPRFFQADLAEEAFLLSRSNLVLSALQKGWSDWRVTLAPRGLGHKRRAEPGMLASATGMYQEDPACCALCVSGCWKGAREGRGGSKVQQRREAEEHCAGLSPPPGKQPLEGTCGL